MSAGVEAPRIQGIAHVEDRQRRPGAPSRAVDAPPHNRSLAMRCGLGAPTQLPWFPTSPAYDEAKNRTFTFDLDKVRSLLEQAGVSSASVDFNYSSAIPELGSMAQILQADVQKIGSR